MGKHRALHTVWGRGNPQYGARVTVTVLAVAGRQPQMEVKGDVYSLTA